MLTEVLLFSCFFNDDDRFIKYKNHEGLSNSYLVNGRLIYLKVKNQRFLVTY